MKDRREETDERGSDLEDDGKGARRRAEAHGPDVETHPGVDTQAGDGTEVRDGRDRRGHSDTRFALGSTSFATAIEGMEHLVAEEE